MLNTTTTPYSYSFMCTYYTKNLQTVAEITVTGFIQLYMNTDLPHGWRNDCGPPVGKGHD